MNQKLNFTFWNFKNNIRIQKEIQEENDIIVLK